MSKRNNIKRLENYSITIKSEDLIKRLNAITKNNSTKIVVEEEKEVSLFAKRKIKFDFRLNNNNESRNKFSSFTADDINTAWSKITREENKR